MCVCVCVCVCVCSWIGIRHVLSVDNAHGSVLGALDCLKLEAERYKLNWRMFLGEELLTAQIFMQTTRSLMFLSLRCAAFVKVTAANISLNLFNITCDETKAFVFELNVF